MKMYFSFVLRYSRTEKETGQTSGFSTKHLVIIRTYTIINFLRHMIKLDNHQSQDR